MVQLNLTPQQYETVCMALKLADDFTIKHDAVFMSQQFKKVYDEISLENDKSKEEV